ncbi:hypothetical protein [Ancylobacter polymorphus]|uniref:Uncharacterized protein n=1 Tax=Ancylobacter polymorphus TaxID=223390 RepID=A0A9E7A0Y8_9HYPH|nr:hypothetical protein [Ancylobacter polymorphus]UOK73981.1 hypothetical protein K9D25_24750 [Ancylobacter polymorphus]
MLLSGVVALGFLVAGEPAVPVHRVMAAALMMGSEKRYEPPTPEVVPVPDTPPVAQAVPAPVPQVRMQDIAVPPQADTGRPVQRALPAPIAGEAGRADTVRLAQAPTSTDEVLRRLERLEQENQKLRQELEAAKNAPAPGTADGLQPRLMPPQMVGGWRVSLYPWNPESSIGGGAILVFNMPNQKISATLGQKDQKQPNRIRLPSTDMFVYRMEGWLHVTREGRHELGFEVNCGFDHPCNLFVSLGGVQILNRRAERIDTKLLQAGLDLVPGDYPIEIVWGLSKNNFIKWEPSRVSLFPLYRPPGEYNYRTFGPRELLTEAKPGIPYGLPQR